MKKLILALLVAVFVGVFITAHATWILILTNLIWLLVKGHTLVSWWWPISTGLFTVVIFGAAIAVKLSKD